MSCLPREPTQAVDVVETYDPKKVYFYKHDEPCPAPQGPNEKCYVEIRVGTAVTLDWTIDPAGSHAGVITTLSAEYSTTKASCGCVEGPEDCAGYYDMNTDTCIENNFNTPEVDIKYKCVDAPKADCPEFDCDKAINDWMTIFPSCAGDVKMQKTEACKPQLDNDNQVVEIDADLQVESTADVAYTDDSSDDLVGAICDSSAEEFALL
eukprot:tig00001339_g8280.t1